MSSKIVVLVAALVGYWVLLRWVPVPGAGVPVRDIPIPIRSQPEAWLDRHLMPGHLYENWTTNNLRDPEGLLSDLPAVGTALLGLLTGMWLRSSRAVAAKTKGLATGCIVLLALGLSVVGVVPAEQETLDKLVCIGVGRMVAGANDRCLLG